MSAPACRVVEGALLLPPSGQPRGPGGWRIDGGVHAADGTEVVAARHRGERAEFLGPALARRDGLPATPGTWMFGGWLQPHFGHLVLYGLGRLWALEGLRGELAGVVFLRLPDRAQADPARDLARLPHLRELLACLGLGAALPWRIATAPERFARLAVPDQVLFGAGRPPAENAAFLGTLAAMRRSRRVRDGLVLPGLYVSRARLPEAAGGLLFEELLEANLMAEGYAVMHPERLEVAAQIGAYAGARRLVFAEGSALHLAVGCIGREVPTAILARRPARSPRPGDLLAAGLTSGLLVDAVLGGVVTLGGPAVTEHATVGARALLDMARVGAALAEAGMVGAGAWRVPDATAIAAGLAAAIAARQAAAPGRVVRYAPREELLAARLSARG